MCNKIIIITGQNGIPQQRRRHTAWSVHSWCVFSGISYFNSKKKLYYTTSIFTLKCIDLLLVTVSIIFFVYFFIFFTLLCLINDIFERFMTLFRMGVVLLVVSSIKRSTDIVMLRVYPNVFVIDTCVFKFYY